MEVTVARHAGFCFGVKRALDAVAENIDGSRVCTYGPIIHNPQIVDRLLERGVKIVESPDQVSGGTVIIRAHGAGKGEMQELALRADKLVDATCPLVERVHRIAAQYDEIGYQVIIVGEPDHPEVVGTRGWCVGKAHVISTPEQARALEWTPKLCAVAQTTIPTDMWAAVQPILRSKCAEYHAVNTICAATERRQAAAAALAGESDVMLVVGGRQSANTRKLAQACAKRCARTYHIESPGEIPLEAIQGEAKIGITAGASTPDWMIKEVLTIMDELKNDLTQEPVAEQACSTAEAAPECESIPVAEQTCSAAEAAPECESIPAAEQALEEEEIKEASFREEFEKTLVTIRTGQILKGTVVQLNDNEVCVNIGYKSDGFIPRNELAHEDVNPTDILNIGDEIEVEVLKVNDGDGNVLLSKKNVDVRKNWDAVLAKCEAGEVIEGIGKEVVKGGLIANVQGIRAFIPASHLSTRYVENLSDFIGKPLRLKPIEVDRGRKRIVASRKQVLIEEAAQRKRDIWERLVPGEKITCTVRRITDFGAFADVGGVDGLIHVTDLSWGRVKHPSDVVKPGDVIEVLILSVDPEKERISLGYKQLQPRPWDLAPDRYPAGMILEGKVVRIVSFGAFIELEPGLDGLVHISQVAQNRINKVEDVLQVGDIVNVKVLEVDKDAKRISLSIRQAMEDQYADDIGLDDQNL